MRQNISCSLSLWQRASPARNNLTSVRLSSYCGKVKSTPPWSSGFVPVFSTCAAYNRRPYKELTAALTVLAGDPLNAHTIRGDNR